MARRTWHERLLGDEDIRRWFQNVARGARTTADNYLRILGLSCERMGLTPAEFAELDPKERDDRLDDYIQRLLDEGKAGSYAAVVKKAASSWLDHNGLRFSRRIKVPGAHKTPTLADAQIPSQEDLRRVLNAADARARTVIGLMAFGGVREQVLGTYLGTDGLRLRAFPELELRGGEVAFSVVPTQVVIPETLSKTGRPYFTFLGPEGCDYLTGYLRDRREGGEDLGEDTPLIQPKFNRKDFIRANNIGDLIRKPMRAAGLRESPYIWRSFFSSRAMLAESKGLLKDWKEFFMGHKGGVAEVYSLGKQLPPDAVEAMRKAYGHALDVLETTPRGPREDPTLRVLGLFLKAAGHTEEEIAEMDLAAMSDEEIVALLERGPDRRMAPNGSGLRQRVVDPEDLAAALGGGWIYRGNLKDGRVVVESEF